MLSTYDLAYLRLLIQESPDFYLEELADEMSTYLGQSKSLIWNTLRWMKDGVYTEAGVYRYSIHIPVGFYRCAVAGPPCT